MFNYEGHTASKNSGGGTGSSKPDGNKYQVEQGSSYIETTGQIASASESGGMKMKFKQSIGNHYWMTAYCGYNPKNSDSIRSISYSPLYDGIAKSFSFKYKKYDKASGNKHRFRVYKIGVVYRTADTSYTIKDHINLNGSWYNLMNFVEGGTYTGTVTVDIDQRAQPMGIYFQLETQGNGTGTTSSSYITVYDIQWQSTQSKEAIMMPYETHWYFNPPTPERPIWTS